MSPRADPKPPKRTALKPRAARAHRRAGALVRQQVFERERDGGLAGVAWDLDIVDATDLRTLFLVGVDANQPLPCVRERTP